MKDMPKRLNRGIMSYLLQHNGYYIHDDDWFGWLSRCSFCTWWCSSVFVYERILLSTHYRELLNSSF
jgi:hypothetical protein